MPAATMILGVKFIRPEMKVEMELDTIVGVFWNLSLFRSGGRRTMADLMRLRGDRSFGVGQGGMIRRFATTLQILGSMTKTTGGSVNILCDCIN